MKKDIKILCLMWVFLLVLPACIKPSSTLEELVFAPPILDKQVADEKEEDIDLANQADLFVSPPPHPPLDDDFFHPVGAPIDTLHHSPAICGDGIRGSHEQCDDANDDNKDGCNNFCLRPLCSNGVIEKDEECDDYNFDNGDGCNNRCLIERCGNRYVEENEECDDGNLENGDGCSDCCRFECTENIRAVS